jgi:hypothetical protein
MHKEHENVEHSDGVGGDVQDGSDLGRSQVFSVGADVCLVMVAVVGVVVVPVMVANTHRRLSYLTIFFVENSGRPLVYLAVSTKGAASGGLAVTTPREILGPDLLVVTGGDYRVLPSEVRWGGLRSLAPSSH